MPMDTTLQDCELLKFGDYEFTVARPHCFGLVIERPVFRGTESTGSVDVNDYLHTLLLSESHRTRFLALVASEGLVVCKNVVTSEPTYRKVRGKSGTGKLSQAEYWHHDGCSCPVKPQVVEIRLPHQSVGRDMATGIAPFRDVVAAMLATLPDRLKTDDELTAADRAFNHDDGPLPDETQWDVLQGRVTRLVRREMDTESSRAWFRDVDVAANAYFAPWEMGESRLMANNAPLLSQTMQHRRALQKPREQNDANGSLVKRWTAEEYPATTSDGPVCNVVQSTD